jgi:DNA-binding CsgD family transcriptional regulator
MNLEPAPCDWPSPRHGEIARLLVARFSDKEIAAQLGVQVGTVRKQLDRMSVKFGTRHRLELGDRALRAMRAVGLSVILPDTPPVASALPPVHPPAPCPPESPRSLDQPPPSRGAEPSRGGVGRGMKGGSRQASGARSGGAG